MPVEPVVSAGLEPGFPAQAAGGNGPTGILQALSNHAATRPIGAVSGPATLPLEVVVLDRASSRPGNRPVDAVDDPTLLRLALWLADVAAEAALAASAPVASSSPGPAAVCLRGEDGEPPVAGSAR